MPGYTYEQLKQMGATPVPETPAQPSVTGGYTYDELLKMGAKPVTTPTLVDNIKNDLVGAKDKIVGSITQSAQHLAQDNATGDTSLGGELKKTGHVLEGGLGAAAGVVQGIFSPITAALQSTADATGVHPVDSLMNSHVGQKFSTWASQHPEAATNLQDILTVGTADLGVKATTPASKAATDLASMIGSGVKDGTGVVKDATKKAVYKELPGLNPDKEAALKTVADDWRAGTQANAAGYKKATKILEKNPDVPQFLAEQGMSPYTHLEDGKYATADSADTLREQAGKMSSDMLRPSLQVADYSVPRTSIIEIRDAAIANVRNNREITAGNKDAIIQRIKSEAVALQRENTDGLSLTAMHDNKITYAQNGGYSPVNDPQVNNTATANRALSSALGKAVEKKAPADIQVDAFNKGLSKYYKAADYLNEINTKKAPVSLGQKIARNSAKFVGAAVGAHTGGILSEVVGYQVAYNIEKMLENIALPYRAKFLDNLARENPKVFQQVQNYLNTNKYGSSVPRLPQPTSIITPAPTEEQQAAGRARQILGN